MVFSSIPFLYYFLPCVLLFYFAAGKRARNAVLLLASLVFYAWSEPKYVLVMLFTILTGYIFGILIERKRRQAKLYLTLFALISLGILGYCKYMDFFISTVNAVTGLAVPLLQIALPVGISFYTFQILSYVIDVYRADVPAQKNFVDLAAYIAMFPQLIAGPIVRYSDVMEQLKERSYSFAQASLGIRRFVIGLAKKVLIANTLGELCSIFKESDEKSVLFFWMYAIAYTIHVYYDFSGYSDMAIGLGHVMGFRFVENFNYPYISGSVTEFWRRWHMSLGTWFRDYVYIPLGGNRVSKLKWFRNILVVWLLTGMWHGASWNFICWGLLFAVFLIAEKLWLMKALGRANEFRPAKVLRHVYTLFVVMIGFILFDAADLPTAGIYIGALFGVGDYPLVSSEALYYLGSYGLIFLLGIIGSTPIVSIAAGKLHEKPVTGKIMNVLEPIVLIGLMVVITAYIVDGSFNPFLYFRF